MGFILKPFDLMNASVVFVMGFFVGTICSEFPLEMVLSIIKGISTHVIGPLGFTIYLLLVFACFSLMLFLVAGVDILPSEDAFIQWLTDTVTKATKLAPTPVKTTWWQTRWNKLLGFHLAHMDVNDIETYHYHLGFFRWVIIRPKDKDVRVQFIGLLRTWFPMP